MEPVQAFDLHRMFLGDQSLLYLGEIVVRTCVMYLYALFVARFIGKRGMGQMTPLEYIIVIALGSATGDAMFYPEVPLLHGMLVLTVVAILQYAIERISRKNRNIAVVIESAPALLIKDGTLNETLLGKERMNEQEFLMHLRQHGVRYIEDVERAYLEPSGQLSVFRYPDGRKKYPADPHFPRMRRGSDQDASSSSSLANAGCVMRRLRGILQCLPPASQRTGRSACSNTYSPMRLPIVMPAS